jgi:hypothetical protein
LPFQLEASPNRPSSSSPRPVAKHISHDGLRRVLNEEGVPGATASFDIRYGDNPGGNPAVPHSKTCPLPPRLELFLPGDGLSLDVTANISLCGSFPEVVSSIWFDTLLGYAIGK